MGDVNISALVVSKIAAPIQNFVKTDLHNLTHLQGLTLAHPFSSVEKFDISLLVGVDYYWKIVGNHIVQGKGTTAMQSKLGFLLSGLLLPQPESVGAEAFHTDTTQILNLELPNFPESLPNDCSPTPTHSQQGTVTNQLS